MDILDWYKGLFSNQLLIILGIFVLIIIFASSRNKKAQKRGSSKGGTKNNLNSKQKNAANVAASESKTKTEDNLEWLSGIDSRHGHSAERLAKFEKFWPYSDIAASVDSDPQKDAVKRLSYLAFLSGEKKSEAEKKFEVKYGDKTIAKKIVDKELWIGMSKDMLLDVKGSPDHKTERVSSNKKKEEYFYGEFQNLRGNDSYKFRVVLVNDEVISWNDIS
jgi:hypothetical protein